MATATTAKKANKAKEYLKNWIPYRYKRYVFFAIVTIVSLALPFIKINDAHFFSAQLRPYAASPLFYPL
jgi:hypothetical protein